MSKTQPNNHNLGTSMEESKIVFFDTDKMMSENHRSMMSRHTEANIETYHDRETLMQDGVDDVDYVVINHKIDDNCSSGDFLDSVEEYLDGTEAEEYVKETNIHILSWSEEQDIRDSLAEYNLEQYVSGIFWKGQDEVYEQLAREINE